MTKGMFAYAGLMVYIGITLGIIVKMLSKGIKSKRLLIAPFIPMLMIVLDISIAIKNFKQKDRTLWCNFKEFIRSLRISFQYYPIFVGFVANIFAEYKFESAKGKTKVAKHKKTKTISSVDKFYNLYSDFYKSDMHDKLIMQ